MFSHHNLEGPIQLSPMVCQELNRVSMSPCLQYSLHIEHDFMKVLMTWLLIRGQYVFPARGSLLVPSIPMCPICSSSITSFPILRGTLSRRKNIPSVSLTFNSMVLPLVWCFSLQSSFNYTFISSCNTSFSVAFPFILLLHISKNLIALTSSNSVCRLPFFHVV